MTSNNQTQNNPSTPLNTPASPAKKQDDTKNPTANPSGTNAPRSDNTNSSDKR